MCVRASVRVLSSCPEACDPDVRLFTRSVEESTLCSASPLFPHIEPRVVSFSGLCSLTRCTLGYLSSMRFIVEHENVPGIYVCACVCAEATRFVCIPSLFVHIWLETQEQPVFPLLLGMDEQVITSRINAVMCFHFIIFWLRD